MTAGALLLGCVIGLLVGVGRLNPQRWIVYNLCSVYLLFFRGTPLLVQLFIWFFGSSRSSAPDLAGVRLRVLGSACIRAPMCRKSCAAPSSRWTAGRPSAARSLGVVRPGYARHHLAVQAVQYDPAAG